VQAIYELNEKQIQQLHQLYLGESWSKHRSLDETRQCVKDSQICIGLVDSGNNLVAFTRVLTDYVFKALVFDVIVSPQHRGDGLGDHLVSLIKNHDKLGRVKHIELYCLPALQPFYKKHGFSLNVDDMQLMRFIQP
jgi:predicted GNAT family N-acyltransferase